MPQPNPYFFHRSLKYRALTWISTRLLDGVVYTVRHGLLRGMRRKGGLGWLPAFATHGIEDAEYRFWCDRTFEGKTVYDVGAFHGLLTMHFAASAVQVICYEPNLRNRTRLEQNLELNGISNVCIRPVALSSARGTADMFCDMSMPGYATIDSGMATEVGRGKNVEVEHIAVTTLDDDIVRNGLRPPDFIKIDVEGLELEVLRGARETLSAYRPDVFLEMHGETMIRKTEKITAIVNLLSSVGYAVHHVESGTRITPDNPLDAAEGHIYGVCAPSEPIATPRS